MSRYDNLTKVINNLPEYSNILQNRGKNFIEQYRTPVLRYPTITFKLSVMQVAHVWAFGDKFFSLAENYYQDMSYWYLIGWFNEKPTEQHINIGETIYIPMPLNKVLGYYNGG